MADKETRQIEREERCYRDTRAALLKSTSLVDSQAVGDVVGQLMEDVTAGIDAWVNPPAWSESYGQAVKFGTTAGLLHHAGAESGQLAWLTLRTTVANVKRRQNLGSAASALGRYVEEHLAWTMASSDKDSKAYFKAVEKSLKKSTSEHHSRAVVRHVLRKQDRALEWTEKMHFQVGAALIECMVFATGHVLKHLVGKGTHKRFVLELRPELMQALAESIDPEPPHPTFLRPMHCPAHPWYATS